MLRSSQRARSRAAPFGLLVVAIAVAGGLAIAIVVAQREFSRSVEVSLVDPPISAPQYVSVAEATFGTAVPISVLVEWHVASRAARLLPGFVTAVNGDEFRVNGNRVTQILRIDDSPVYLIQGDLPFYRDLGPGSSGEDVRQLQQALVLAGHLAEADVDGRFGARTFRAVRELDAELLPTGSFTLRLGSLVAFPEDAVIDLSGSLVGAPSPEQIVAALPNSSPPELSGLIGSNVRVLEGMRVQIDSLGGSGVVTGVTERSGEQLLILAFPGCDASCPLPVGVDDSPAIVTGELELSPTRTGLAVPVAVLAATLGDDNPSAIRDDGSTVELRVLEVEAGLALIETIDGSELSAGDRFLLSESR